MKYVSKFKLFSNEIFIKDKEARENLDVVNNNLFNINNSLSELENNVVDIEGRLEEKYSLHYRYCRQIAITLWYCWHYVHRYFQI